MRRFAFALSLLLVLFLTGCEMTQPADSGELQSTDLSEASVSENPGNL